MIDHREIVSLLGLKKASMNRYTSWLKASCPSGLHIDKNPSFGINLKDRYCFCFSCGFSMSLMQLIVHLTGMNEMDAAIWLFENDDAEFIEEEKPPVPLDDVSRWCREYTPYWEQRGISRDSILRYRLGYSPEMDRAVVPVFDNNVLVGWTARTLTDGVEPKWLHAPFMDRRHLLFGLDQAISRAGSFLIVCEAPLDAIFVDSYGYSAIAIFGAVINQEQADLIRTSGFNRILLALDPDMGGQRGTERALKYLLPYMDVGVMPLLSDDLAAITKEEFMWGLSNVIPAMVWENPFKEKS